MSAQVIAQQLYVAYFGRPADAIGFQNFQAAIASALPSATTIVDLLNAYNANNATIRSLVNNFSSSDESKALYTGDTLQFVNAIYQNVLDRDGEPEGLAFWTTRIDRDGLDRAQVALEIIAAAVRNGVGDAETVAKKTLIAQQFTDAMDTSAEILAYSGEAAAAAARAMLNDVNGSTDVAAFATRVTETLADVVADQDVAAGESITLTTGLDIVTGTNNNDIIDARPNAAGRTVLDQFDDVDGGAGRDTLIVDGNVDLSGVSGVEELATTAREITLNAAAVSAGIDTVNLRGANQVVALNEFASEITVNGNASSEAVAVNLTVAGDKTLNLGAGTDFVGVEVTGEETAADAGSIEVRFESAKVGDATDNSVSIIGSASTVTVNDEGTVIAAGSSFSEPSIANLFKVQGINADGSVAENQNRGNFSYVVLGTETEDNFNVVSNQDLGLGADLDTGEINTPANVYINAGTGDDTLSATAEAGQRHFLVGGTGDDVISTLTMSGNGSMAAGTVVVLAGAGDDEVTVGSGSGSTGIENIDLGTGDDTLTVVGGLNVNKAEASSFAGGAGRDVLVANLDDLLDVAAPIDGDVYTVSGFEELTIMVGGEEDDDELTLANIQEGLATVNAATDISDTNIVFDVSDATINLAFASGSGVMAEIAGEGTNDTLTINNALRAVENEGEVVARNAFSSNADITVDGIENIVLNGTGLPQSPTSTVVPEATTQFVGFISDVDVDAGELIDTVTLTGSNSFDLEGAAASTVDASGLTGEAGLFMNTLRVVVSETPVTQTIIGSDNTDEIFLDGDDEPESGESLVEFNINLGAGDDQVELDDALTVEQLAESTIAGGAGRDALVITRAFDGGSLVGVSGFEVLSVIADEITGQGSVSGGLAQDMLQFVGNTTFDTIRIVNDAESDVDVTFNNVANTITTLELFSDDEGYGNDFEGSVTVNRLVDNNSNAITIKTRAATADATFTFDVDREDGAIELNDEETITIDTGVRVPDGEDFNFSGLDINSLSATDLTNLVLTGEGDLYINDLKLGQTARVVKVDASEMIGYLQLSARNAEFDENEDAISLTQASVNLVGSSGDNEIDATENSDVITIVSDGNNYIYGNGGNDTITVTGNGDFNLIDGGDGNDIITVTAQLNADVEDGESQVDIDGGAGNDTITVTGTAPVDIEGGSGADTIVADSGDDFIAGGEDADLLTGGAGKDTFFFVTGDSTARAGLFDTITDFDVDQDMIDVEDISVTMIENVTGTNEAALLDFLAQQDGESTEGLNAILYVVGGDGYLFIDSNDNGTFETVTEDRNVSILQDDPVTLQDESVNIQDVGFDVFVKLVGVTDINDINFGAIGSAIVAN